MKFADDTQRNRAILTLLALGDADSMWTDTGPTNAAIAFRSSPGAQPHAQRTLLRLAWWLYDKDHHEAPSVSDIDRLPMGVQVAELLGAIQVSSKKIDAWIYKHGKASAARNERLIALQQVAPDEWADIVIEALNRTGSGKAAADALEISERTMRRWLKNPVIAQKAPEWAAKA